MDHSVRCSVGALRLGPDFASLSLLDSKEAKHYRLSRLLIAMMNNLEVARVLNEYATLLEIQGESPFQARAYHNAARTVEQLAEPIARRAEEPAELMTLPGIGERMAAHIREIVETGTLAAFQQAQKAVPRSLTTLLEIESLGPKKAKQLYEHLGVTSVTEVATCSS
jgi:DNA polymerase (family 10)